MDPNLFILNTKKLKQYTNVEDRDSDSFWVFENSTKRDNFFLNKYHLNFIFY